MAHKKSQPKSRSFWKRLAYFILGIVCGTLILGGISGFIYEKKYQNKMYPGVSIAHIPVAGKTPDEVTAYWLHKNIPFKQLVFTFKFENQVATLSGTQLDIGFDATLSATQSYDVGRAGSFLTNTYHKYQALKDGIDLQPLFRWNEAVFDTTIANLSQTIDIEPENALFEFKNGRVVQFKTATAGRAVDQQLLKRLFQDQLAILTTQTDTLSPTITFDVPVKTRPPLISTEQTNNFGIEELVGQGESYFQGSIPERIHNVTLAASRINGTLIPPGELFSFNNTVGDISAATGYKQAYVIKSGHTVLDDGGGVCQVSTTLFRAALNAGLSIVERHAHSYRVGYYEQGGFKPGFDATVYAPSYDLKIKNDTTTYILIQAKTDVQNLHLTFELYGKKDGRSVEISAVRLNDPQPAPADLYQDDPTLPQGKIKQVDWANTGIKAAFDYTVRKNEQTLFNKTFVSNYIPWQAVYLRGTAQ